MILCDLCNRLTVTNLYPPNIYTHAENLAALEASAEDCRLCRMIHGCIKRGSEFGHHPQLKSADVTHELLVWGDHEARDKCSIKLQIIPGHWSQLSPQKGFTHMGIWMKSKWMVADLTLSVEEGDELGSKAIIPGEEDAFIYGRVLVSECPPQAHFDVARRWLDRCEAKHHECCDHDTELPELPARVIYVAGEGQDSYLVSGIGKRARYATLSHCWGRSTAAITTMESLRTRQDGISSESLPKTFKEAIICCRKLGVPYLWIDSLCIVQDDKDDWERESGHMGSIYYNSTLTLAATDSPDSSKGLFIPRRPHDDPPDHIVTLPISFGSHNGQAYVTASTWGVYGPPASDIANGILQTRGWVMQEKYLARRTLHFLAGQMVWVCCERILGQSGFNESFKNNWLRTSPRREMEAFAKGFEGSYTFGQDSDDDGSFDEESRDDEDGVLEGGHDFRPGEEKESKELDDDETSESSGSITTLLSPKHGRASSIVDLRDPQYQTSAPPTLVTRQVDNELYNFLDVATRQTIYHIWYSAVEQYSTRELTFPSDKLPALAGIASRVRDITHDQYIAGHWRRELERSLFWQMNTEPMPCPPARPARAKKYRAPSWSWASVNGLISFSFADLAQDCDKPASIEVLEASTQVEGGNPFGCVSSAKLNIKASIIETIWNAQVKGWILSGIFVPPLDVNSLHTQPRQLKFFNGNGSTMQHVAGFWDYDDNLNGILPGPPLAPTDSWDSVIVPRLVPGYGFLSTPGVNRRVHGKEFMDTPLWERGTYVPEDLVLVKGPVRKTGVDVLVLAKAGGEGGEGVYRRVGMGQLGSWDEAVESVEILTVV